VSEHVRDHLSPFLDGELPAPERAAVEAHLQGCAECAAHLEELVAVDALARDLPVPAPADGFEAFPARVRDRIARHGRRPRRLPAWALAVAATLLLAVITPLTLYRSGREAAPAKARIDPYPAAAATTTTLAASPAPERELRLRPGPLDRVSSSEPVQAARADEAARDGERPKAQAQKEEQAGGLGGFARDEARQQQEPAAAPPAVAQTRSESVAVNGAVPAAGKDQATHANRAEAKATPPPPVPPPQATPAAAAAPAPAEADQRLSEREAGRKAAEGATVKAAQTRSPLPTLGTRPGASAGTIYVDASEAAVSYETRYAELEARQADTPAAARELREAWRALARSRPDPGADQARAHVVDMGLRTWQLSGERQDRDVLLRDLEEYLARDDAGQAERMRALQKRVKRP
jgi:putative zinc finger protein